jgi:uncharacterized repeat protein (TIGR01451 family)
VAFLLAIVLVSIVAYRHPRAHAQSQETPPTPNLVQDKKAGFIPGELLVRFRPGTSAARTKNQTSINAVTPAGQTLRIEINHFGGSDIVPGLMLARVPAGDTLAALQALRARTDVAYVEPNFIRHLDVVPNDPHYQSLWGLKNPSGSAGGISAESAWDTTTGNHNVVVGVIDSGIDIGHRDLNANIFVNTAEIPGNNVDDDNDGFVDDVNGWDFINNDRTVFDNPSDDAHGTHVAGTIGARGNNAAGVVGVNWDVQLLPLKAIGPSGGTDASLLSAFHYAKMLRQRGVNLRVLNNSYGAQRFSQSLLDAIKELGDVGILFVAAAGNDTLNNDFVPHFPASYDLPNVISVAASTESNSFDFTFSNRGKETVHLAAPGVNILSTTPRGFNGQGLVAGATEADGSTYSNFSGTSMASPHVAGAAALACAANPNITLEKLRAAVLSGVDESGAFQNLVITGGRLNANRTVQFAIESDTTAPAAASNFRIASQNGRRIELRWNEAGDDGTSGRASLDEVRFIDSVSSEQFRLSSVRSLDPGTERVVFVSIPIRHPSGQLSLRTVDNAGNMSTVTVNVSLALDVADPYIVTVGAPAPLTPQNTGTIVGPRGDDVTAINHVQLPFPFPFFGFTTTDVVTSSNGALYVPIPPDFALPLPNLGPADFAAANGANLENLAMVAGMWSDLRTDRNPTDNVYMVQPDLDRVIFRWQGVTFGTETPVNFEIELRRDGTIQTRYGNGNTNLQPVIVGISGGDPDAYLIDSHSSQNAPLSLTNAQSVTFALRNPPPPPSTDLVVSVSASPNPALSGQNVTFSVRVNNLGPSPAHDFLMTNVLPAGATFVSCSFQNISATCIGPPIGSTGTVTGRINPLEPNTSITFNIVAKITAAPGASLVDTASATSFRPDPNPGNNSASVTSFVVAESFFNNARAIAAGRWHTTTVRNDGTVWVWGTGDNGQLGDGNSGSGVRAVTPVQVAGLEAVDMIADGNGFVYAVKNDGTVWGWGLNSLGQLGDGTTMDRPRPVQAKGLTNVKGVDAGDFYGAAVKTDGTVWHWGASQALISNNFGTNPTPLQLNGIADVSAIAAGGNHLLMLKTDKTVWGIGANDMGQLGDGSSTKRNTPVQVAGLSNVGRIAAGGEFGLALKEDGTVWAWGLNRNGQLGPGGGSMDFSPHPNAVQVTGLPAGIKSIAAGPDFCLAIASDGTIWSWGNNSDFQLGQGNQVIDNATPKQIPNFGNVAAVAAGSNHSVALKTDGSVWCWGANTEGQCGDGSTTMRFTPARVSGLETVSSPAFNPLPGGFLTAIDVTITCSTPGATIHYTINGEDPTESDPVITSGASVHLTGFVFLRARAWKPGLVPSSTTIGTYDVNPPLLPLFLLLEENGPAADQVSAVDTLLMLRDPFPVTNTGHLRNPIDPNTRIIVFALNLDMQTGEPPAAVTVNLIDANGATYNVPAEDVRSVAGFTFKQVIFRLPNNLAPGTTQVRLIAHTVTSNSGTIRIKP